MMVTACGSQGTTAVSPDTLMTSAGEPSPDVPTFGQLGPVRYGFAPQRLKRAEIELGLPPLFDESTWAMKFLPIDRAERLGRDECSYGSEQAQTCTAEAERGLALALLERPIADYRRGFLENGIPARALHTDSLNGASGFCFTSNDRGSGNDWCYYSVAERTLLVARRYAARGAPVDPDLGEVLNTLRIPT